MASRSTPLASVPRLDREPPHAPACAMGRRTLGLSAREAVLGLVIEQPDSASRLCQRLMERFRSARFTRSTAHNALTRLTQQGLVRMAQHEPQRSELGRYEATARGRAHFQAWVRRSSPTAPVLREELQAKVEFCAPEDLAQLIEAICAEERACASMFAAAQGRLSGEELIGPRRAAGHDHWSGLMRRAMLRDEAAMWGMRFKRLERLRTRLEGLREEAERCAGRAVGLGASERCATAQGKPER
jgi:DNA-binding PadR family transcriptional regulator